MKNAAYRRKSNLNQIVLYFWVLIVMISAFSDFSDGKTKHLMINRFQVFCIYIQLESNKSRKIILRLFSDSLLFCQNSRDSSSRINFATMQTNTHHKCNKSTFLFAIFFEPAVSILENIYTSSDFNICMFC